MNATELSLDAFFRFVDTDQDGSISYPELVEALSFDYEKDFGFSDDEKDIIRGRDLLLQYFTKVDVNRDGLLSKGEVSRWFATSQNASAPPAQLELTR